MSSGLELHRVARIQSSGNDIFDCQFVPDSAKVVVLGGKKQDSAHFSVHELDCAGLRAHPLQEVNRVGSAAFKCGTLRSTDARQLAAGNFAGALQVFDLEHAQLPVYTSAVHAQCVNAIDGFAPAQPAELVTAGRDGCVCVHDTRAPSPVLRVKHHQNADCWTVRAIERGQCVAGYENGDVAVVELRTGTLQWAANVKDGVAGVDSAAGGRLLLCGTVGSRLHLFDRQAGAMLTRKNAQGTLWAAAFQKQQQQQQFHRQQQQRTPDLFATVGGSTAGSLHLYRIKSDADNVMVDVALLHRSASIAPQPLLTFQWCPSNRGLCAFVALDQSASVAYFPALTLPPKAAKK